MSILVPVFAMLGLASSLAGQNPDGVVTRARETGSVATTAQTVETATPSSTVTSATRELSTAEQIDRWLEAREPVADAPVWRDEEPRRVTGEVNLGIGSHDYRDFGARVQVPLGENGTLSLGYSETRNAPYYRPTGRDGLFWDPRDPYGEWAGAGVGRGLWTTPSGRSLSPVDDGTLIPRRDRQTVAD